MRQHDEASIPALIRGVMSDARELIREEIALARAELREEAAAAQSAGVAFGGAALLAVIGVVLFCIALGGAIADLFDAPPWVGYGVMSLLLGGVALFLVAWGRARMAAIRGLPQTKAALRENITWIQSKSGSA